MTSEPVRVLAIVLPEAEYKTFVARHPQPVEWLRNRIKEEIQESPSSAPQRQTA